MKTERLIAILLYLLQKKKVTAEELAEHFEVSKRTIYRDLDALTFMGIPIVAYVGKQGGFTILEQFRLNQFTFLEEEKNRLLESLTVTQALFGHPQTTLQNKLNLLKEEKEPSHSLFQLSAASLHRAKIVEQSKVKIRAIMQAIAENEQLLIVYIAQTGERTERTVIPSQIHFQYGSWYVEAYCTFRQAVRMFKVTRIRSLTIGPNSSKQLIRMHRKESKAEVRTMETIVLQFDRSQRGKLYDFFTEEEMKVTEDGITVMFQYEGTNILPFLLMFGRYLTGIEPQWLQKKYQEEIDCMRKH